MSNKLNESMLKHMVIESYLRGYVTMMTSDDQVNSGPKLGSLRQWASSDKMLLK